jgi:hypothetical protein
MTGRSCLVKWTPRVHLCCPASLGRTSKGWAHLAPTSTMVRYDSPMFQIFTLIVLFRFEIQYLELIY